MASDEVRALAAQISEAMKVYADSGFSTFTIDPIELRGQQFKVEPKEWRPGPGRREEGLLFRIESPPPSEEVLMAWVLVESRGARPYVCSYLEQDLESLDRDKKHLTSSHLEMKGNYFFLPVNAKTEVHLDKRQFFVMACSDAGFTTIQREFVIFIYEQNYKDRTIDDKALRLLLRSFLAYTLVKAHFQGDRGIVLPGL
ncbi:MAG: hypothetical protein HYR85_12735 [Planctomycetes bacterium]|nr:hypothetical protein [Planctomycetota bacterium]MBI3846317.1 hypothetical protein [Planctomycetota bacterium]